MRILRVQLFALGLEMYDLKLLFSGCVFIRLRDIKSLALVLTFSVFIAYSHAVSAQSLVDRISSLEKPINLTARGIIVPNAEVTLSTSLSAPISALPLKAGAPFEKGDRLVQFDCGRANAELRGAEATSGKQRLIFQNRDKLRQRNAATVYEVAEARADYQVALSQVEAIEETVKFCEINAPFSGRVLELHSDIFEVPASNTPLLTVVDDSILELDLIVPSKWLQWIKIGGNFEFSVEETGENHQANIIRLGAKVDAVSQTIKITGIFLRRPQNVLPGMSGFARFDPPAL